MNEIFNQIEERQKRRMEFLTLQLEDKNNDAIRLYIRGAIAELQTEIEFTDFQKRLIEITK